MPKEAAAQALPTPVLKCVAGWLFPAPPRHGAGFGRHQTQTQTQLVPLMSVCRAWRQVFGSLFYGTVLVEVGAGVGSDSTPVERALPTLVEAVSRDCQRFISRVQVNINSINTDHPWNEQIERTLAVLRSCGALPLVYNATFNFQMPPGSSGSELPHDVVICRVREAAGGLAALVDTIAQAMPNIRSIGVGGLVSGYSGAEAHSITNGVLAKVFSTFGAQGVHAAFDYRVEPGGACALLPATRLKSIAIPDVDPDEHIVELIRSSSQSLERLHIGHVTEFDIVCLVASSRSPEQSLVYPHLKHLVIDNFIRGASLPQLLSNPFPALETLRCQYLPTRMASFVLRENRACLRHLAIDMTTMLGVLRTGIEAGNGTFTSLNLLHVHPHHASGVIAKQDALLLAELLELCPHLSTLRMELSLGNGVEDILPTLRVPLAVRHLDLMLAPRTIGQVAAIICACPQLVGLKFGLVDGPDAPVDDLPTDETIQRYLDAYRGTASGICHLELTLLHIDGHRRRAESIVLLAAMFPTLIGVYIPWRVADLEDRFAVDLQHAINRPVYKNVTHLQGVLYDWDS